MPDQTTIRTNIAALRADAAIIDKAATVLFERGAMHAAERVRKAKAEWLTQADEMERRLTEQEGVPT